MVWVSHFCGSTRTLGKNALVKSRWERILDGFRNQALALKTPPDGSMVSDKASRVENRRSGFSLPVAVGVLSHGPPQSGLAWFCFLFPLIEPDRQISRIRLSEKTHAF
jgi:hypothetical protein